MALRIRSGQAPRNDRGVSKAEREWLEAELERYAAAQRQQAIAAVENWWDKYRVSLREIETGQEAAVKQLDKFVAELGYAE